jgi:hypothetical protein
MELKDLLDELDNSEAPTINHAAADEAVAYTKFLGKLHIATQTAYNFENHAGFGRGYPGSPMIDMEFSLTEKEVEVLNRLKERRPFKADNAEYLDIIQEAYIGLAEAHGGVAPAVRHDGKWVDATRSSFYTPHVVFLTGPKSLITAFHEYTHSLGFGEVAATWWSTNVFRLLYPASFKKLRLSKVNPHLMRRHISDELVADKEFCKRKSIGGFRGFMDERNDFFDALDKKKEVKEKLEELIELVDKEEKGD